MYDCITILKTNKQTVSILQGVLMTEYIIEIEILPFCKDPTVDPCVLQLHPVYEDEEGRCYFRRSASLQPVSLIIDSC